MDSASEHSPCSRRCCTAHSPCSPGLTMTRWTHRVSTHLAVDVVVLLAVLGLQGLVVLAHHAPALRPLHEARARDAARAARGWTQRPGAPGALHAVHGATAAGAVPLVRLVVTARAPALGLLTKGERIDCHTSSKCNIRPHTPSCAFRHLPPNSARFSYATEGALFISAHLSTDAVSAFRKVWGLWKQAPT